MSRKFGFTLVELLCTISIVSVLMGLSLIAIQSPRAASRLITCQNNLRQMGIATANFESAKHYLPPAAEGWATQIAPYYGNHYRS